MLVYVGLCFDGFVGLCWFMLVYVLFVLMVYVGLCWFMLVYVLFVLMVYLVYFWLIGCLCWFKKIEIKKHKHKKDRSYKYSKLWMKTLYLNYI